MEWDKYLQQGMDKGFSYNSIISNVFFQIYKTLNLNPDLEKRITDKLNQKVDFELSVSEMKGIIPLLDNTIETLMKSPDFNPFKEALRKKSSLQYGSYPFVFNGTTYYLYPKGWKVDRLISNCGGTKDMFKSFIKADKPVKFKYKKEES